MSRSMRICLVSPNKAEKRRFINQVYSQKFYPNDIIKRQNYILIFKDSQRNIPRLRRAVPIIQQDTLIQWEDNDLFSADGPKIPEYLDMFTVIDIQKPECQNIMMIVDTCRNKLQTECCAIQMYDIPFVRKQSSFGNIYIKTYEDAFYMQTDIILVILQKIDCFKDNIRNISSVVGESGVQKVWIVIGTDIQKQDVPLFGDHNKLIIGPTYQSVIQQLHQHIILVSQQNRKLPLLQRHDNQNQQPLDYNSSSLSQIQPESTRVMNKNINKMQKPPLEVAKPFLLLSDQDISKLSEDQILSITLLLKKQINNLPIESVKEYNQHLKQIGYNRPIKLPQITFRAQVVCFIIFVILSVIFKSFVLGVLSLLLILTSVLGRFLSHRKHQQQYYKQMVERNHDIFWNNDGIISQKIKDLQKQMKRRVIDM